MSGSYEFTPGGELVIMHGARKALDTAGRLVTLLPSASDYSGTVTLSYPDVTKDWAQNWQWQSIYNGANQWSCSNRGDAWIAALPQEWSSTTTLVAAPTGCNLAAGAVRLTRTTAPANQWNGQTINPRIDMGEWLPLSPSFLLEAQLNFARAFSLYIDSGNLVLHQQQSVGAGPGGGGLYVSGAGPGSAGYYGDDGSNPPGFGANFAGGEWVYGTAPGHLIYNDPATMSTSDVVNTTTLTGAPGPVNISCWLGQPHQPPHTANPVYTSVYSLEIAAKFGRAS